jgi:(1->4)-alpha-D-glucan 1-alpha-D-glucosylmutase
MERRAHDTKRGEDARARLYTLTEAPELWAGCVARWRQMNQTHVRFLNDGTAPKAADTWMLYQALAGVWPPDLAPDDEPPCWFPDGTSGSLRAWSA